MKKYRLTLTLIILFFADYVSAKNMTVWEYRDKIYEEQLNLSTRFLWFSIALCIIPIIITMVMAAKELKNQKSKKQIKK